MSDKFSVENIFRSCRKADFTKGVSDEDLKNACKRAIEECQDGDDQWRSLSIVMKVSNLVRE